MERKQCSVAIGLHMKETGTQEPDVRGGCARDAATQVRQTHATRII